MQGDKIDYNGNDFCVIGIYANKKTKCWDVFVGNASYFKRIQAMFVCHKYAVFLVDDIDLLIEKVHNGEISGNQVLEWLNSNPACIHLN